MAASSYPKARRFSRSPVLFASIQIGNKTQGLILNASEGGICVQATAGAMERGLVDLRFQSAQSGHAGGWVECRGRIVWTSESKTVAGIEFVDSTPEIAREIRNWLSFGESLQELHRDWRTDQTSQLHWADDISERSASAVTFPGEPSPPNADAIENGAQQSEQEQLRPQLKSFGQGYEHEAPRSPLLRIAAFGLVILVGTVILARQHFGSNLSALFSKAARSNQSLLERNHVAPAPVPNPPISTANRVEPPLANSPSGNSDLPPSPADPYVKIPIAKAPAKPGLMLQAGAMTDQKNANEMAQSLQQKKFPAFVYKKDGDRFYRVLIGPYASDESLRQAQAALRRLDIPTIKKNSAP